MAGAGGLALVLLGGLIGFVFVGGAFALLIYGFATRNPRRGFIASMIALMISVLSALLSAPFWIVVLSGHDTHGEPLDYGEVWPFVALVVVEALAILASTLSAVRQRRRRMPA